MVDDRLLGQLISAASLAPLSAAHPISYPLANNQFIARRRPLIKTNGTCCRATPARCTFRLRANSSRPSSPRLGHLSTGEAYAQMDAEAVSPPIHEREIVRATQLSYHEMNVSARQIEAYAYNALIDDGGRPSHPLTLIDDFAIEPGRYRDILAYWQDLSDEWRLFNKQLSRWRTFRAHQRASREADRFPSYVEDLTSRLRRHGFELPSSFDKSPSGFSRHINRQDGLTTWVEYLNYEFTRRDEYDSWLETCRPGYDEALTQLFNSGVLRPLESSRDHAGDICRPSSIELTRQKYERRRVEEAYQVAENRITRVNQSYTPLSRQEMDEEDAQLAEAEKRLAAVEKRANCISDFKRKTHAYRFALDTSERHELLLQWALDQVPLIEKEMQDRAKTHQESQEDDDAARRTFHRFRQLPPEIRLKIWRECLPTRPTVHFFEVLNQQRRRHLAHSWSSQEFRVRPTAARDSGYRVVYTLLATCREARLAVETRYMHQSSRNGDESGNRHIDFRTFDWIPAEDLVVLCFPPIQVPQLPATNAITIKGGPGHLARHVGVLVPKEVLIMPQFNLSDELEGDDDSEQVWLLPGFVKGLQRKSDTRPGVKKLYFIVEGWTIDHGETQSRLRSDSIKDLTTYPGNRVSWRFEAARSDDTISPWKFPPVSSAERQFWRLESGNAALVLHRDDDIVQRSSAMRVKECLRVLERGCRLHLWHESFEGVGFLGWMEREEHDQVSG